MFLKWSYIVLLIWLISFEKLVESQPPLIKPDKDPCGDEDDHTDGDNKETDDDETDDDETDDDETEDDETDTETDEEMDDGTDESEDEKMMDAKSTTKTSANRSKPEQSSNFSKHTELFIKSKSEKMLLSKSEESDVDAEKKESDDDLARQKELELAEKEESLARDLIEWALKFKNQRNHEKAIRCFNKAIKIAPNPLYYIERGKYHLEKRCAYLAKCDFEKALKKDPKNEELRFLLSEASFQDESYQTAVKAILPTGDLQKILELGSKLFDKKAYQEARRCYNWAIQEDHLEPSYYRSRGKCNMKLKEYLPAIIDFERVLLLGANTSKEDQVLLSNALFAAKRYEEAVDVMMLTMDDTSIGMLGSKLFKLFECKDAIRCYDELLTRDAEEPFYYEKRGVCYWRLKNLNMAIADFERVIELAPFDIASRQYYLVPALVEAERYDDALATLEYFETNFLSTTEITTLRKNIRKKKEEARKVGVTRPEKELHVGGRTRTRVEAFDLNETIDANENRGADGASTETEEVDRRSPKKKTRIEPAN